MSATRCPGCHVVATPTSEHLDDCPYQGRNALPLPETDRPRSLDDLRGIGVPDPSDFPDPVLEP